MFKKGLIMVLAVAMLLTLVLSACGQPATTPADPDPTAPPASETPGSTGGEEEPQGGRITDEKITLKFSRLGWTDVRPPAEELWMWQRYEEITNVHIEWDEIPREGYEERKNIMLAANDLPDAFYQAPFSTEEIGRYGAQNIFIGLNDLLEANAPNLTRLMQENETVRKAMTMPDGNIYSLPYVQQDVVDASLRYYINQKWLENLGLEIPKTIEQLNDVLRAFKEQDANGNGDPNDEYPVYHVGPGMIEQQLLGSYGIGNRGLAGIGAWIDMGPDGNVRFYPADPRFKEVWQLMNDWWKAGYWHPESWSGIDYARWVADAAEGKVGLYSWVGPGFIGDKTKDDYWGITAFVGPHGDAELTWQDPLVRGIWSFMITNKNQYAQETIKWVDFFYGEEGTAFGFMGEEGVTFTRDADGNPKYIDEIANYDGGQQLGSFQWVDNVYGGFYPYVDLDIANRLSLRGVSFEDEFRIDPNDHIAFMPKEVWASFPATVQESDELSALLTDMNAYIGEMRVKFITGEASLDSEWDTFVSTLKRMGSDRYLEIKQQQYERYSN